MWYNKVGWWKFWRKGVILISDHPIDKIHLLPVILLMVSLDREQMVLQSLSITFWRVWNTSFLKPSFLISFHICSIGFISGVYGGIKIISILSGIFNEPDLCQAAPSHAKMILSLGNVSDNSFKATPHKALAN